MDTCMTMRMRHKELHTFYVNVLEITVLIINKLTAVGNLENLLFRTLGFVVGGMATCF